MTKQQTTSHHPVSPRDDVEEFRQASLPPDLEAVGMPTVDSMAPVVVEKEPTKIVPMRRQHRDTSDYSRE